jgi:hypothetical protein
MNKLQAQTDYEHRVDYLYAEIKSRFTQTEIYALAEDVIKEKIMRGGEVAEYTIQDLIECWFDNKKYEESIVSEVVYGILDNYLELDELGDRDERFR